MGDGQNLTIRTELLHESSDSFGHGTSDARIHLVKNQGLGCT